MRPLNLKECIYCAGVANSKEHVPPRSLLETPFPPNLKTYPACSRCNGEFSKDEQYFLTLLAQIGTCPSLTSKIEEGGSVDRALRRSPALDERITQQLRTGEDGRVYIEPEFDRVNKVLQKVALGLYVRRYSRVPDLDEVRPFGVFPYNIVEMRPGAAFAAAFTERFRVKKWQTVQKDIFSYIFVRQPPRPELLCLIDFHGTAWGIASVPSPASRKRSRTLDLVVQPQFEFMLQGSE